MQKTISNKILSLMITFLLAVIISCGFKRELSIRKGKVEQSNPNSSDSVFRKFDQVVEYRKKKYVVEIIQEFDSKFRVIKEYGFHHPWLGKQYLFQIFYFDSIRVINQYSWNNIDTPVIKENLLAAFTEQRILIDSSTFLKAITITKIKIDSVYFFGKYLESFPVSRSLYSSEPGTRVFSYTFKMFRQNLVFDDKNKLILKDILITAILNEWLEI